MIIKRSKIFSPVIFDLEENIDKEFIDLERYTSLYKTTSEAYILAAVSPYYNSYKEYVQVYSRLRSFRDYIEFYGGFADNYSNIVALIVRDKEYNKYLIVRSDFKETRQYQKLVKTLRVFDLTEEYVITASKYDLQNNFCTILSPSMEDYEAEVKQPIARAFIQNLRKEYEEETSDN